MKKTSHILVGCFFIGLSILTNVQASCSGYYVQKSFVLQGNLLASLLVTTRAHCEMKCRENSGCFSINYYKEQKNCHLNKATHLSRPLHLVYDMGGVYIKIKNDYCSDAYCSTGQSCLIDSAKDDYICKVCNAPLGLESGSIPNSSISASSSHGNCCEPWQARLRNSPSRMGSVGSWVAKNTVAGEYLQVDLGNIYRVTKVATQGSVVVWFPQWITSYSLSYAFNNGTFTDYKVGGSLKVFPGNTDRDTIVTNVLPGSVRCRYIRIVAVTYSDFPAMRAEIYGCPEN
ncbi:Lactadherin [Exaiptasia diaphana]|nr:Lactadherin [Exaiptasia diaphana]